MKYQRTPYTDTYEILREHSQVIIGHLQKHNGTWRVNLSKSCGWLSEEDIKSLSARLTLLNMDKGKPERLHEGF